MDKRDEPHFPVFLTARKAAEILNVSASTVRRFIHKGILKTLRVADGHYFIRKKDLFLIFGRDIRLRRLSAESKKSLLGAAEELHDKFERRQRFCRQHSKAVAKASVAIAQEMKFSAWQIHRIYLAGLLHDVGMIKINADIVNKITPLTDQEYFILKTHPLLGADMVSSVGQIKGLADIVKQHHERYDGMGYPDKLAKNKICLEARIVALADAFACMTAKDSYKGSLSKQEALEEIRLNSGRQFDPQIAKIFLSLNTKNPFKSSIIQPESDYSIIN